MCVHVWFGLTAGKFTTQAHIEYFWETQPDTSYVLLVNEWLYLSYCCLPIISKQPDLSLLTSGINNIFSSRELPLPSPVLILEKDVWANPRRSAFSEVFRPENQHQCHVQNRLNHLSSLFWCSVSIRFVFYRNSYNLSLCWHIPLLSF